MSNHVLAVCVRSDDYEVSLKKRKLDDVFSDFDTSSQGQIRVIDGSGEDYLYPRDYFIVVDLPEAIEAGVLDAA